MATDLTGRLSSSVTFGEHVQNVGGYFRWLPKKPGSKVLVKWVSAFEPWGPWRLAKPRYVASRRRRPIPSLPRPKRVVARY